MYTDKFGAVYYVDYYVRDGEDRWVVFKQDKPGSCCSVYNAKPLPSQHTRNAMQRLLDDFAMFQCWKKVKRNVKNKRV